MNSINFYCLMHSGKPLSESTREVLLENAQWMRYEGNQEAKIKHPQCVGLIKSNLESVDYMGFEAMEFYALIDTPDGTSKVNYIVRVSDLDDVCMSKMKWGNVVSDADVPPEIKAAAHRVIAEEMARKGLSEDDYEIGEGIGIETDEEVDGPLSLFFSGKEDDEQKSPFSNN